MEYKDTLNLPKTAFPMKADLPRLEPRILELWRELRLNERLLKHEFGQPTFILHDGPPYANGDIHVGHTLNKVLKDIIVKHKAMVGYHSPYVPGWDCHGQPIEHEVEKRLGGDRAAIDRVELRRQCREYALRFVDRQREQFIRLGVTGDWRHPYLTLDHEYEATNVRIFSELYQQGLIYKGRKPIHWCYRCRTALAEAEIEYAEETSPSIYVKFRLVNDFTPLTEFAEPKFFVIWTTTPWTLPANVAVAVHPRARYAAVSADGEIYIIAEDLVRALSELLGRPLPVLASFAGSDLESLETEQPLMDWKSRVVLDNFVSLEQGTGCVHIAPGHGEEDWLVGQRYELPAPMPVDDRGYFTDEAGKFSGRHVKEANEAIIEELGGRGLLVYSSEVTHAYPHCWRCKTPLIQRSTVQWFISMSAGDLRTRALDAVRTVRWIPEWSVRRISAMVGERPDWCISRQRAWGVPIPVFYCQQCDAVLAGPDVLDHVERLFAREGADIWFSRTAAELLPPGTVCAECGSADFRQETDILDVWFESGVSHAAVLRTRRELSWPADLYVEGSDQHRGWFQSSLLTSVGADNAPPYKAVLTHGFLVDGQGRKMSKSLGNVIDPLEVIKDSGADILRLWVCSADYATDIAISPEILARVTEAYRRIRNTLRFILGNLYDFDPSEHGVVYRDMEELDRWALMRLHQLIERVRNAYEAYRFHQVYHAVYNFCTVDMSAFYLDVLKDRLYTYAGDSQVRRSAQTALHEIISSLLRLVAPVLVFTAEEAWQLLGAAKAQPSVHLAQMPEFDPTRSQPDLEDEWNQLLGLRGEVAKALEEARNAKLIGDSLEARLDLYLPPELYRLAASHQKRLPAVFIVSQALVHRSPDGLPDDAWRSTTLADVAVKVGKADGSKCARCWNYRPEVGVAKEHPLLCQRCLEAVGIKGFGLDAEEI